MAARRRQLVIKSKAERKASVKRSEEDSRAKGTTRQYGSAWRGWEEFCDACEYPKLPSRPEDVKEYLSARFYDGDCSVSTVSVDMSAIGDKHRQAGYPSPLADPGVKKTMGGIRRAGKTMREIRRSLPFTRDILDQIHASDVPDMHVAYLETAFAAALRIGESSALLISDVSLRARNGNGNGNGGALHIRESKTDQTGEGVWVAITHRAADLLRPIMAGQPADAPLFRDRKGTSAHPYTLARWTRSACKAAGIPDWKSYTGHATRRGCISTMGIAGIPTPEIAEHTRHETINQILTYTAGGDTSRAVSVLE